MKALRALQRGVQCWDGRAYSVIMGQLSQFDVLPGALAAYQSSCAADGDNMELEMIVCGTSSLEVRTLALRLYCDGLTELLGCYRGAGLHVTWMP